MITIANFIANTFIFGLGLIFIASGLFIFLLTIYGFKDAMSNERR